MKTIGLLGGMSWESSAEYYRIVNQEVNKRLGSLHSAKVVLYSVDFDEIETLQHAAKWDEATQHMVEAAQCIERAGADFLLICTNTMHKMADEVADAISIPLVHIADATGAAIKKAEITKVALLGTRFTMEQEFYRGRLERNYNLDVLIPQAEDREIVHSVIYDELCKGIVQEDSRTQYRRIIDSLARDGAEGVILGCTEISLLVKPEDYSGHLFDTTYLHAIEAVDRALA